MAAGESTTPVSRRLATSITAHAWNADGTMLAISPNLPEVWIYVNCTERATSKWEKKYVLAKHDLLVSGVDWCHATNAIVTCSHDRSAFVWNYDAEKDAWLPTTTVLRLPLSCTGVKWSDDGRKLAVASTAKVMPVLAYDATQDWWVGKQLKAFKSSVTDIAWHPSGRVLAAASTDMVCRIFAVAWQEADGDNIDGAQFGTLPKFGEVLMELGQSKSWVHGVAWNPAGTSLAVTCHNATVYVVSWGEAGAAMDEIISQGLPSTCVAWLSNTCFVAAGHSMNPEVYALSPETGTFELVGQVDPEVSTAAKVKGSFGSARAMFAAKVSKGQDADAAAKDKLRTKHTAAISQVRPRFEPGAATTRKLSTCSVDGRVVEWDMASAKLTVPLEVLGL